MSRSKFLVWHDNNIGNKINELTIGQQIEKRGDFFYVLCTCSCGIEKFIRLYNLASGKAISCGHTSYASEHQAKRSRKQDPQLTTIKRLYKSYKREPGDTLTLEEFIQLSQKQCYYCGSPPLKSYNYFTAPDYKKVASQFSIENGTYVWNGIDRIDSSLPHIFDNCISCCYICNRAKSNMSVKEFYAWIAKISDHIKRTS